MAGPVARVTSTPVLGGGGPIPGPSSGGSITYITRALGGFSSSNTVISAVGQIVAWGPGKTFTLVLQTLGTVNSATETILACVAGTSFSSGEGVWVTRAGTASGAAAGHLFVLSPSSHFLDLGAINAPASNGITRVLLSWRLSDNAILVSVNGGALISAGPLANTVVNASCRTYVGSPEPILGSVALTSARILGISVQPNETTGAAAQAITYASGNRFALGAAATAGATFVFNASDFNPAGFTSAGGSSPVAFAVAGTPALVAVAEKVIAANNTPWGDGQYSAPLGTVGGQLLTQRLPQAHADWVTDAASIGVDMISTVVTAGGLAGLAYAEMGVRIGGSYSTAIAPKVDSMPLTYDVQTGGGTHGSAKAVSLVVGPALLSATLNGTANGTYPLAFRLPLTLSSDGATSANSAAAASPAAPAHQVVLAGHSIPTGFNAFPTSQNSQAILLRATSPSSGTAVVTCFSIGSESAHDIVTYKLASWVAGVLGECRGIVKNDVVITLETNDYGAVGSSVATFTSDANSLLVALYARAADLGTPGFRALWVQAIPRVSPAIETANGAGATLSAMRAVVAALPLTFTGLVTSSTTTASWSPSAGWTTMANALASHMSADGIHPGDATAEQAIVTYLVALTGW